MAKNAFFVIFILKASKTVLTNFNGRILDKSDKKLYWG